MKDDHPVTDPCIIDTDFGLIKVRNELPDTVTLAVDDGLGAQRILLLQLDEAHRLIDALNAAIRAASTGGPHIIDTEFGSITIRNELPEMVTLAMNDGLGAQRVLFLQLDEAHQLIDALHAAIRAARTEESER
ncbi:hypothetical protein [Rhodococcus sp. RDE2]|uniref:hypothetical protein n=1 Tax=Rhodococcus sp. RDE2 TaxID=2885078 RepID=UPI001E4EF110|nr:hypothetical protein [Rhodococcus sp. RDE2]BDB63526.1 hypothetical protein RDE2_53200 [Rhodococcus sp. RDE2]